MGMQKGYERRSRTRAGAGTYQSPSCVVGLGGRMLLLFTLLTDATTTNKHSQRWGTAGQICISFTQKGPGKKAIKEKTKAMAMRIKLLWLVSAIVTGRDATTLEPSDLMSFVLVKGEKQRKRR